MLMRGSMRKSSQNIAAEEINSVFDNSPGEWQLAKLVVFHASNWASSITGAEYATDLQRSERCADYSHRPVRDKTFFRALTQALRSVNTGYPGRTSRAPYQTAAPERCRAPGHN
jgi:hypothetical protein